MMNPAHAGHRPDAAGRTRSASSAVRMALQALTALALMVSGSVDAAAFETSCDITTGASCLWGEGCDCDHDGFIHDKGKYQKYCHTDRCPIDQNDLDASVGGKPTTNNKDGDGFTEAYDCDDNDPCIDGSCTDICVGMEDLDGDGVPAKNDCDDEDAAIKPGSPIACCACETLTDPAKVQQFGCDENPCPLSENTMVVEPDGAEIDGAEIDGAEIDGAEIEGDTVSGAEIIDTPDAGSTGSDDAGSNDAGSSTDEADGGTSDTAGGAAEPPADFEVLDSDTSGVGFGTHDAANGLAAGGFLGGGNDPRDNAPSAGCTASDGPAEPMLGAWLLLLLGLGTTRGRRWLVGLLLVTTLGSCAMVKPWQREQLARPAMLMVSDGLETALENHVFQYREGSAGGFGFGGGGCGCN